MSLVVPSRRLALRCRSCNQSSVHSPIVLQGRRTAASSSSNQSPPGGIDKDASQSNPLVEEYLRKKGGQKSMAQQLAEQVGPLTGDISASSLFEDDRRRQEQHGLQAHGGQPTDKPKQQARNPAGMKRTLDPHPNLTIYWQRRKVIQMMRKNGRLSKDEMLKRTEREHLARSHNMKTSVKKLGMLARQIAGKSVDSAITQMRFSKKKIAAEVLSHLEYARDVAVVSRGMGLGLAKGPNPPAEGVEPAAEGSSETDRGPMTIQLKDGKRHTVTDPSKLYVAQAWVGRGPYGRLQDIRAMGRANWLRTPHTSISLLLKEEATRVREFQEREEKKLRKRKQKPWVALPDRPIQQPQTGWYCW